MMVLSIITVLGMGLIAATGAHFVHGAQAMHAGTIGHHTGQMPVNLHQIDLR
ncbi:hypothetical protein [Lactiplantibacillus pentosus]|uniref:hypothetical protein n=2 Tax=Lactiplantibacillus pentosus TaxID=1589 RepID=UPI0013C48021|nr:hypothetical protein [Lactiplantibacillus pentosus]MCJ8181148.1 hypothetical protein [Lactiplantibacillus pentosus]